MAAATAALRWRACLIALVALQILATNAFEAAPRPLHNMKNITGPSKRVNATYQINLDLQPELRWKKAAKDYQKELEYTVDHVISALPSSVQKLIPYLEGVLDGIEGVLPEPYRDEIRGISEATGIPAGQLLIVNIFYELETGCTGVVVYDKANNITLHGRNLDYGIAGLQNLTVNVEFVKNNTVITRATTYVGYIGLLTGSSPLGFSVQLNERDTKNGSVWDNAFEALFRGGAIGGFFLRDMLIEGVSFDAAVAKAATQPLIAPCYLIFGGPNGEGAIVVRERDSSVDTLRLSDERNPYGWFLIQTNYDFWKPAPSNDDRRSYTKQHMEALGRGNMTSQALFHNIMSAWPTLNAETTYTTIMTSSYKPYPAGLSDEDKQKLIPPYFTYTRNN